MKLSVTLTVIPMKRLTLFPIKLMCIFYRKKYFFEQMLLFRALTEEKNILECPCHCAMIIEFVLHYLCAAYASDHMHYNSNE